MPVRLLNSSVLKWPDAQSVNLKAREWASRIVSQKPQVHRIGYFGSYARGDWGVGSDLDVVIVVENSALPFEKRSAEWDVSDLPIPADVLVYTRKEWQALNRQERFYQTLMREAVWLYVSDRD